MLEAGWAEAVDGSDAYPRYQALDPAALSDALRLAGGRSVLVALALRVRPG